MFRFTGNEPVQWNPYTPSPADFLDWMGDVIEARGHTRGREEDYQGRVCAMGAASVAKQVLPAVLPQVSKGQFSLLVGEALNLLATHIFRVTGGKTFSITEWNDQWAHPGEVLEQIRKGASALRGGGPRISPQLVLPPFRGPQQFTYVPPTPHGGNVHHHDLLASGSLDPLEWAPPKVVIKKAIEAKRSEFDLAGGTPT